jgi:hypothetical protein
MRKNMKTITPPTKMISPTEYNNFREILNKLDLQPSLQIFKDTELVKRIAEIGKDLFHPLISAIAAEINDPDAGICVLDIPTFDKITPEKDAFLGIVTTFSIIWNLITPSIDSANATPFTVYTASKSNGQKLDEANLSQNVPEVKLGFHNDGHIAEGNVLVPNIIAIYNILIAYQKPGKFHWVPFSQWQEMQKFADLFGVGKKYKFKIVPNVYATIEEKLDVRGPSEIIAPIFTKKRNGELMLFMNGEIDAEENGSKVKNTLVRDLKNSINVNPMRFSVEQKVKRLILLGNTLGCHARDIFEEPLDDSQLTRAFVRSVDSRGIRLNT